ncbi:glycosyltransferase family 39 protein [Paludisphaera borealis]|uniref:Glycosyltransferase RgtA/B/C/D-like domain-containing protein n=1 Tax=Paludisphaera borealis TaxID=1387353 RepID=A0A1U7CJN5_9BACT|nr:glycosyltransferase family 39 protein [Paludisphaera borealis]APW59118.1 putative glycosyltransferase of unknown function [Paludisphaera borealis]
MHASQPTVEEQPSAETVVGPASGVELVSPPKRRWLATAIVFAVALVALVPTTGDLGLTWDEPAYRHSQVFSAQWWEQWPKARSWSDVQKILDPDALIYYWPYARFGVNFHPPLAGQLNLLTHTVFGPWMKDIPSRRMASVIEFALTITIGFHFLSRRYGQGVGLVMAGSLLLMPRLYGQAHLMDTDIPGLLLWASTALCFWKGLYEPNARRWRVLVGVLMGLAFLEKMAAVGVLLPILLWLAAVSLPAIFSKRVGRAGWIDGAATMGLMLLPLALAFHEIQSLQRQMPPPAQTNLFIHRPQSDLPGLILAVPLAVWLVRRLLGRLFPRHRVWGAERPALETLTAILAFGPVVGWLGNPLWWRETLTRMTHYYTLSNDRQGALPDILIIYFGQTYQYSLPWHNGWVLLAITVPVSILAAAAVGVVWGLGRTRSDRIPLYFLVHMATLPALRMLPTPAHDGVRLFLPTFFFLSAFAGWGAMAAASCLSRMTKARLAVSRPIVASLVLAPALFALATVHPYELSYYNELIGGTPGAWRRGFEASYWYDAFTPSVIEELNQKFPPAAEVDFLNPRTNPSTFYQLQCLGHIRPDVELGRRGRDHFPFAWLLTQDSKASAFTRLLFAMKPWYALAPKQVGGVRLASVADPVAVSRAWALSLLLDAPDTAPPDPPAAPEWVRKYAPILRRFWGDGLQKSSRLTVNPAALDWAANDPEGFLAAARRLASRKQGEDDPNANRLLRMLLIDSRGRTNATNQDLLDQLLSARPEALVEAVEILTAHRDAVVQVMTRYGYTDPSWIGGFLDRDL